MAGDDDLFRRAAASAAAAADRACTELTLAAGDGARVDDLLATALEHRRRVASLAERPATHHDAALAAIDASLTAVAATLGQAADRYRARHAVHADRRARLDHTCASRDRNR